MIRLVLMMVSALCFGGVLGAWWAKRKSGQGNSTFVDIRGNTSFTRIGPAIAIGVSFVAFIVCAYWPQLQKLAETFISSLMNFAAITFGIGKGAEEVSNGGNGIVGKILSKLTGGSDDSKTS